MLGAEEVPSDDCTKAMDQILGFTKKKNAPFSAGVTISINDSRTFEELQPLQSQVAGHSAGNGKSSLGMLLHPDGYILKPVEEKAQGESEIRFYQHLNSAVDEVSQELREFVPTFYGILNVKFNEKDIPCIILQNVTEGMLEPCVMDVKIGKQTWEPSASEEKKNIERVKYVASKRECGFCIPGMQYYDIASQKLVKYGKEYGKQLDRNGIKETLKLFLNWRSSLSHPLILLFLWKLWKILRWFQSQRQFLFYSSSVLFVYDAHILRNYSNTMAVFDENSSEGTSSQCTQVHDISTFLKDFKTSYHPIDDAERHSIEEKEHGFKNFDELEKHISPEGNRNANKLAHVKMIDFAHTLISSKCDIDFNYIEGLRNLVEIFEILLKESC
ncbi:inositol polyphosphate multikinase [Hetaerina americana]|uniref:inositol polyphosphate multikinase n=1 Tax=Hetaerina americana TaxID=62018 RepID=UPI003A7F621B